jgi:hypothetical protein
MEETKVQLTEHIVLSVKDGVVVADIEGIRAQEAALRRQAVAYLQQAKQLEAQADACLSQAAKLQTLLPVQDEQSETA